MAFDVRAMENIATAPAAPAERTVAGWIAAAFLAIFTIAIPFSTVALDPVAGFVPAVIGSAALAQFMTFVLLYVQYRIVRSSQLGVLTIAYAMYAFLNCFYVLTFPQVFSPTGLFHATPQTAAWLKPTGQMLFSLFLIGFALADRFQWRLSPVRIRLMAAGTALFCFVVAAVAIVVPLPALLVGTRVTPLWNNVVAPIEVVLIAIAFGMIASSGLRTVTQVWLVLVTLMTAAAIVASALFSGGRYTLGWYVGGFYTILASSVILAVFLVKINDLLTLLARRNRILTERTETAELELAEGELRYRSLANVVPQLIWSANGAGDIDYVNDRWIDFTGLDAEESRRLGWRAAIDSAVPTTLRDAWHESLRTGASYSAEFRLRHAATGRLRWFQIDAVPVRGAMGDVVRWIGSCTDVDRTKRIEEREAFLARAGARLSASLDVGATLAAIVNLAVERMGAWARVDVLDDDGRFIIEQSASKIPAETSALRTLIGTVVDGALEMRFREALESREVVVDRDNLLLSNGPVGVRSGVTLLVPLNSGDTGIGVFSLMFVHEDRPDEGDIALARDFGRRAAQALDHARLYERERTTADALQRAMLPQVLPQINDVSFSASYSAASESQRVGGDFYDAFVLPNGLVALTIGDVTGHGLEAAVIMGEIRQALRAASFELAEPSTILDRASRLLIASGRTVFVTAVFGLLDRATGEFRYATAGHPSPLVFHSHGLTRLSSSGLPIGLRDDEGVDFSIVLEPGSTIVLFTDGLMEFARDLVDGERRIEEAITELAGGNTEHLASSIMTQVLGDDQATDDIAILTATLGDAPATVRSPVHSWRFHSTDARTAVLIRHEIGTLVARWTGREDARYESELAFGELFSNVVRHAPGIVLAQARPAGDGAELVVTDWGAGLSSGPEAPDMFAESGRGLQLVSAISAGVDIETGPDAGTTITVRFSGAAETAGTVGAGR